MRDIGKGDPNKWRLSPKRVTRVTNHVTNHAQVMTNRCKRRQSGCKLKANRYSTIGKNIFPIANIYNKSKQ